MESSPTLDSLTDHHEFVARLARQLVSGQDADDLEQSVWVEALQSPPRARGSVRGWLTVVGRRVRSRQIRDRERRRHREGLYAGERPSDEDRWRRKTEFDRAMGIVTDAMRGLQADDHELIRLRYWSDLSPNEIASRLGVPTKTVYTRLTRALDRMRGHLDETQSSRGAWVAALSPLMLRGKSSATGISAIVVWCSVVAVLVTAGVGVWSGWAPSSDTTSAPPSTQAIVTSIDEEMVTRERAIERVTEPSVVESAGSGWRLHGRVVDERRWPQAGAEIEVHTTSGLCFRARSEPDGTFEIPLSDVSASQELGVHAFDRAASRAGVKRVFAPDSSAPLHDAGVIVLREAAPLHVDTTGELGVATGVTVRVLVESEIDHAVTLGWRTTDSGVASFPPVPFGGVLVTSIGEEARATSHLHHEVAQTTAVPLTSARSVRLTVVDDRGPVAGVRTRVREICPRGTPRNVDMLHAIPPTSEDGCVDLVGVPLAALEAHFDIDGWVAPIGGFIIDAAADEVEVMLTRCRNVTIRVDSRTDWPSKPTKVPVVGRGDFTSRSPPSSAVADGVGLHLRHVHPDCRTGVAILPDGRRVEFEVGDVDADSTLTVTPGASLEIQLDVAEGPVSPVMIELQKLGGMGRFSQLVQYGIGRFDGLSAGRWTVFFANSDAPNNRQDVTTVSIGEGGARELVVPVTPRQTSRVQTWLGNEARLPDEYSLWLFEGWIEEVEEVPGEGELIVHWRSLPHLDNPRLSLRTPGGSAQVQPLSRDDEAPAVFRLPSTGLVRVHVIPPEDGRYDPQLLEVGDSYSADSGAPWNEVEEHVFEFRPINRGTHRVADGWSGLESDTFVVNDTPVRVDVDFSSISRIEGRVVGAHGRRGLVVQVIDPARDSMIRSSIGDGGIFDAGSIRGEDRRVRVWDVMRKQVVSEELTVRAPVDDLLLEVEPTFDLFFQAVDESGEPLTVVFAECLDEAGASQARIMTLEPGIARALPLGTWTIRLSTEEPLHVEIPAATYDSSSHDVGEVQFDTGIQWRIDLHGSTGRVAMRWTHEDGTTRQHFMLREGLNEVRGFKPGRWTWAVLHSSAQCQTPAGEATLIEGRAMETRLEFR